MKHRWSMAGLDSCQGKGDMVVLPLRLVITGYPEEEKLVI